MEYFEICRNFVLEWALALRSHVNHCCGDKEPLQIILVTFGVTILFSCLYHFLFDENVDTHWMRLKKWVFRFVRSLPPVKRKIDSEICKMSQSVEDGFNRDIDEPIVYKTRLPSTGMSEAGVIEEAKKYKKMNKADWKSGKVSGTVYHGSDSLTKLMSDIFYEFAWTNPLHPDVFLDVRRMEAEVVRMCCSLFNGDAETCGTMTSGGTESILLACRTYRDIALDKGIEYPEIIVPITAHAAFDKSAQFLRMKITHIPVDEATGKVKISAMRRAIGRRTCMLVGSLPGFPHGICDDIDEIEKLGRRYGIPVHVDCCLGGFLYPFMDKAGFPMPAYDFRLAGVTSISCDTHKYAFAPKGSSVILYRNTSLRMRQFYVTADWPGGIYASPTIPGSRPGVVIAQTWAALVHFGESGFVESTRAVVTAARKLKDGLEKQPHIKVFGDPQMSVIGVGSDRFNVFRLFSALVQRGWNVNALQFPSAFHVCCTMLHTQPGVIESLLDDLRACVEEIMQDPDSNLGGMGALYGQAQSIPDRKLVSDISAAVIGAQYSTRNRTPVSSNSNGHSSSTNGHSVSK